MAITVKELKQFMMKSTTTYHYLMKKIKPHRIPFLQELKPKELAVLSWIKNTKDRGGIEIDIKGKIHVLLPCPGVRTYEGGVRRHKECKYLFVVEKRDVWRFPTCPHCMRIKRSMDSVKKLRVLKEECDRCHKNIKWYEDRGDVRSPGYKSSMKELDRYVGRLNNIISMMEKVDILKKG